MTAWCHTAYTQQCCTFCGPLWDDARWGRSPDAGIAEKVKKIVAVKNVNAQKSGRSGAKKSAAPPLPLLECANDGFAALSCPN